MMIFPNEDQINASAIEAIEASAAEQGFEPCGGELRFAYFAPSASGIVPPRHIGKVWAIMLCCHMPPWTQERPSYKFVNVVCWGKVQGPLRALVLKPKSYTSAVAEGKKLIANKMAGGYRTEYHTMLFEYGQNPVFQPIAHAPEPSVKPVSPTREFVALTNTLTPTPKATTRASALEI